MNTPQHLSGLSGLPELPAAPPADFRNLELAALAAFFASRGYNAAKLNNFKKAFRAQPVQTLGELTGIKRFKELAPALPFAPLTLVRTVRDSEQNEKFVFETHDRYYIESVLMPGKEPAPVAAGTPAVSRQAGQPRPGKAASSICVSVQVGCSFGCLFCTTGRLGFRRNLLAHEIIEQVRQIYQLRLAPARFSCVSFMGMGEPLANLENCMQAAAWINSTWGWQVSLERITFSTSGAVSLTKFLSYERLPNLALSLHAAFEDKRRRLMPACRLSLQQLRGFLAAYYAKAKRQPTLEYILFKDFNDTPADAQALAAYLQGLPAKVNLLNYNKPPCASAGAPAATPVTEPAGPALEPVAAEKISAFKASLSARHIHVLFRRSLGVGIGAGCGQLGQASS